MNTNDRRPQITTADSDDYDANTASERPLLRSFPNPSRYGTHSVSSKQEDTPVTTKLKAFLVADVDTRWADLILIVLFFISGSIDAGAYNAYECFTSMQVTGRLTTHAKHLLMVMTDRKYNLRGSWSLKFTSLLTKASMDQIRLLRSLLSSRLNCNQLIPPYLWRA